MKLTNLKKYFGISILGLVVLFGAAGISNAQGNRGDNNQDQVRVRRGGRTYRTDNRGAEMLRQAVNEGYRQGFQAGQEDRRNRHRNNWRNNGIYRSGNQGYDSHVDSGQYRYYFQQGFQKGYDDGYNSRTRYGSNNSILGNILNQIFRVQR